MAYPSQEELLRAVKSIVTPQDVVDYDESHTKAMAWWWEGIPLMMTKSSRVIIGLPEPSWSCARCGRKKDGPNAGCDCETCGE